MSIEETVALHNQLIASIESNLDRASADIATLGGRQAELEANQARIVENQALFIENQALMAESMRVLANSLAAVSAEVKSLAQTVDRFIRYRGNGSQQG